MGRPQRVNACQPQSFIHIDIAKTRQKALVQKQGFDLAPPPVKAVGQDFGGKVGIERLRA
jgi:hypothetical protein